MPRHGSDASGSRHDARQSYTGSLERIVSGGQTGVDRAALDIAIELGIAHGGWCPKGRLAEDGRIDDHYQLQETDETEYAARTERNVVDSCGTLVLYRSRLQRGSLLTYRLALKHGRPVMRVRLDQPALDPTTIQQWLVESDIRVLNVAGPRASSSPGIGLEASQLLRRVLTTPQAPRLF